MHSLCFISVAIEKDEPIQGKLKPSCGEVIHNMAATKFAHMGRNLGLIDCTLTYKVKQWAGFGFSLSGEAVIIIGSLKKNKPYMLHCRTTTKVELCPYGDSVQVPMPFPTS